MIWEETEIGNLVELRQGFCINKKSNHLVTETGIPLLRITDMINGNQSIFISEEIPERFIAKPEDIIFTRTGQVGLVFRNQFGVIHNNCFTVAPISEELTKDFLYWFLRSDHTKKTANDYASGSAQLDLGHSVFRTIKIKYPKDRFVQLKIASILDGYDNLIDNNLKRIALLEKSARLLYEEWFVRLRFPGYEHTTIVDGVPEGWKKSKIQKLGNVVTGKTPSTKVESNFGDEVPFIKIPDMHGNVYVIDYSSMLSENGANTQPNKFIPANSLMISCIGSILGVVALTSELSQTNQQINTLVPYQDNSLYYCYFTFKGLKPKLEAIGGGATMPNVNKSKFESIEILLPSTSILNEFHTFCLSLFQQIKNLQYQNQKLKQARDILLPKLIDGEITV